MGLEDNTDDLMKQGESTTLMKAYFYTLYLNSAIWQQNVVSSWQCQLIQELLGFFREKKQKKYE